MGSTGVPGIDPVVEQQFLAGDRVQRSMSVGDVALRKRFLQLVSPRIGNLGSEGKQ